VTISDAEGDSDVAKKMKAVGSLSILNSFIYAAEGVLHALNLRSGNDD